MQSQQLTPVSDLEREILKQLWDAGGASIRQLTDEIYEDGSDAQYATIQKLLNRLERKGYVTRDRSQHKHIFKPLVTREAFLKDNLKHLADNVCDGSWTPLITTLIEKTRLSAAELQSLRELVERKSRPASKRKRKK